MVCNALWPDPQSREDFTGRSVTLLPNTQITGGTLKGTIKGDPNSPASLEQVRIKTGSHLSGVKLGKGVKLEKGVVVDTK